MKPRLLSLIIANLFVAAPFVNAAGLDFSGSSVSVGGLYVRDNARDPSKLNEYRDLDSGGLLGFEVRGRGDQYYLNAYGENIGRDDMYLDLNGGQYGVFKYRLYDSEMRHNLGSGPGAISPFTGIGGANLGGPLPNTNPATWNTFDHSYKRRDLGGMIEYQTQSPWYFRTDAKEVTRKGINVFAGAAGTNPGQGAVDLPSPIDYTTRDAWLEAGYSTKRGHFAINVMNSKFSNGNQQLNWFNANAGVGPGTDTTNLPPDNDMWRLSANGNLRQLPGHSTLAGRLTYSKLESDASIPAANLWGNTGAAGVFNGKMEKMTASVSLNSNPMDKVDTKLYVNWVDDKNKSTQVTFVPTGSLSGCILSGTTCAPELFAYKKNNLGIEAGYRLNRENRLRGGYDYVDIERERIDFIANKDNTLFVEWKNSSFENVTGRLKYQHLSRRSDYQQPSAAAIAGNPLEPFIRRYDLANREQNLIKLVLDVTPVPMVDLGFEAIYKKNDYKDTLIGRTDDDRQEYYASISFGDPNKVRVLLFGDVEFMEYNSFHRVGTGPTAGNPFAPATASTYNWGMKNKDKAWQLGVGADFVPMNRLKVNTSLIYAETNGTADFTVQQGGIPAVRVPIGNFDNTRRTSFNVKGIYNVDKHWELTGGYSYEKYTYNDIGYNDTQYVIGAGGTATYFTGQNSFQPYTANIFYLIGKYTF